MVTASAVCLASNALNRADHTAQPLVSLRLQLNCQYLYPGIQVRGAGIAVSHDNRFSCRGYHIQLRIHLTCASPVLWQTLTQFWDTLPAWLPHGWWLPYLYRPSGGHTGMPACKIPSRIKQPGHLQQSGPQSGVFHLRQNLLGYRAGPGLSAKHRIGKPFYYIIDESRRWKTRCFHSQDLLPCKLPLNIARKR